MSGDKTASVTLLSLAMVCYSILPALNYYAHGWEYPMLLTGVTRLIVAAGTLSALAVLYPSLLSREGLRVTCSVMRAEWKLLVLVMLTTADIVLFCMSYRFVDISVSVVLTAMTPATSVIVLAMLTWGRITRRQSIGLAVSAAGVPLVTWAGGAGIETLGNWWETALGTGLALGAAVCGGLLVAALRLGEALGIEWYWNGLGEGTRLVRAGTMVALVVAQGATAPLLVLPSLADLPSSDEMSVMVLMGLTVLVGTLLWSAGNRSGWQPVLNSLGYLQPLGAVLILAALGISEIAHWGALTAGMVLIVGSNLGLQVWGHQKV